MSAGIFFLAAIKESARPFDGTEESVTNCDSKKMAEESTAATSLSLRLQKYLKEAPFFCKIVELVRLLVIIILIIGASRA